MVIKQMLKLFIANVKTSEIIIHVSVRLTKILITIKLEDMVSMVPTWISNSASGVWWCEMKRSDILFNLVQ